MVCHFTECLEAVFLTYGVFWRHGSFLAIRPRSGSVTLTGKVLLLPSGAGAGPSAFLGFARWG